MFPCLETFLEVITGTLGDKLSRIKTQGNLHRYLCHCDIPRLASPGLAAWATPWALGKWALWKCLGALGTCLKTLGRETFYITLVFVLFWVIFKKPLGLWPYYLMVFKRDDSSILSRVLIQATVGVVWESILSEYSKTRPLFSAYTCIRKYIRCGVCMYCIIRCAVCMLLVHTTGDCKHLMSSSYWYSDAMDPYREMFKKPDKNHESTKVRAKLCATLGLS